MSASIRFARRAQLFPESRASPPLSAADRLREHSDRAKEDCVNLSRFAINDYLT